MKQVSNQFIQWVVLSLFVFSMVFTIYLGADFYKSMSNQSNDSLNQRAILLYFNHRFNQSDSINGLDVKQDIIIINHDGYFTLIYEEDGNLMEQVSEVDFKLEASGQKIAVIKDLQYSFDDNQIKIVYYDSNNERQELVYTLKSLREVR
ncbi:MAG: DUF4860 domain-containing protein [Ignavibacteria bacterium]|nr:DUF4860 domain-containing protein [Ignavibacteria bacterium]